MASLSLERRNRQKSDGDRRQQEHKSTAIQSQQVLKWYFAEFQRYLGMGATRLMVIGYGFNDPHINNALLETAPRGLSLFIIDPLGVDAADPTRSLPSVCSTLSRTSLKPRRSAR